MSILITVKWECGVSVRCGCGEGLSCGGVRIDYILDLSCVFAILYKRYHIDYGSLRLFVVDLQYLGSWIVFRPHNGQTNT